MNLPILKTSSWRLLSGALLAALSQLAGAADTGSWSVASPNGRCEISVSFAGGRLSYRASRDGQVVIQKSPMGLRCSDGDYFQGLRFEHADKVRREREQYELFAGVQPRVDHRL